MKQPCGLDGLDVLADEGLEQGQAVLCEVAVWQEVASGGGGVEVDVELQVLTGRAGGLVTHDMMSQNR